MDADGGRIRGGSTWRLCFGAPLAVVQQQLLDALLPALEQFDRDGLPPFLARYAALDVLAGRAITVHGPQGDEQGVADGIGDDGALRVRMEQGVRQVHAGEVSVRAT